MYVGMVTSCRALNAIAFSALPTLVEHDLMRHRGRSSRRYASVRAPRSASPRYCALAIAIASSDTATCAAVSSLEACPTPALSSAEARTIGVAHGQVSNKPKRLQTVADGICAAAMRSEQHSQILLVARRKAVSRLLSRD